MARTIDQNAADVRDELPEPGDTAFQHLRHTLAVYDRRSADELVIEATTNIYGNGVTTGLTWGDLHWILDWMERSEEHLRPDHPAFR